MNPHDISSWQSPNRTWFDHALTVICIIVLFMWMYSYFEALTA